MTTSNLRFGALIRVSTEKQEQQGESLRTQRLHIERDVQLLGGRVVAWYGGQEHATPGHEKKEVDRLIADAIKGKFDAVIVANADRWSRDNTKSTQGIDAFKKHGVRFFVAVSEYDLFNPEHVLFLGMSAVIGQFQANHQSRKSVLNRIERAKRGLPASGKLPFGRTYNKATEKWGIDPAKKAMVEDCARRYLSGEPIAELAKEYGLSAPYLHKVMTRRCGPEWEQMFESESLNIHETVKTPIPALLSPEAIDAILQRADENKTFRAGQPVNKYLFGRLVFCGYCGHPR